MAQLTYDFKVRDSAGKVIKGTLDADNTSLVAKRLREMGYVPLDITARAGASGAMRMDLHLPGHAGKVPLKVLAVFSRQFATLISSGLTLFKAITILEEQTEHPGLAKIIGDIRSQVERGVALSEALSKHTKAFSRLYVAMVKAGEASGALDKALLSLADTIEKQVELRGKIKSAMAYPVASLCIVLAIAAAVLLFIVPVFKGIFTQLGGKLPAPTLILVDLSNITVRYFPLVLVGMVLLVIGFRRAINTPNGRVAWDTTKLKAPVFGGLMRKTAVSRFTSTLSALLSAGVPVLEALEITRETVNNVVVSRGVDSIIDGVKRGEPIARGLNGHTVFPTMVTHMISVGEETGGLDSMLEKASTFLDNEIERTVESLTSLLEPLMILVLGGAVGSMVICLYLPMFKVTTLINNGHNG
ncbi:MAG TPA: type II secretion system F family protein [Acidimicrobiales bacterium]|nr:type II secretion system F family protein [Acidimicrobiales bacterium]